MGKQLVEELSFSKYTIRKGQLVIIIGFLCGFMSETDMRNTCLYKLRQHTHTASNVLEHLFSLWRVIRSGGEPGGCEIYPANEVTAVEQLKVSCSTPDNYIKFEMLYPCSRVQYSVITESHMTWCVSHMTDR